MAQENTNENLTPISAEELAKQEEVKEEKAEEVVEEVEEEPKKEETDTTSENDSPEKSEEEEKENDEENGEVPPSDEGNEGDGEGSGEVSEDVEGNTEKIEDKTVEENNEEEPTEAAEESVDDLKAQIEEYKFNEEERAGLQNLAVQIQNAQTELDDFDAKVDAALRDALIDNKIDLDKSLDELGKENPAAYKVAIDFIQQANQVKNKHAFEVAQRVRDVQNNLIFKRAEREFAKYKLTPEEADVAADTFIRIMHEVGVNDLGDDLKLKVSLSVGQSKVNAKAPVATDAVEEVAAGEIKEEQPIVEEKTDEEPTTESADAEEPKEEHKEEPKEEEKAKVVVDLEEYMADPTTSSAEGQAKSNFVGTEILTELAKLKGKEQQAFYVEHATEINKAMAEVRKNMRLGS